MNYQSTRSELRSGAMEAVLQGLAPDGGLFTDPEILSRPFDWKACLKLSEQGMAEMILKALLPGFENMDELVHRAYSGKFENERLSPLVPCGDDFVLELYHGPTSAFKDVALSMLPQLITQARKQLGIKEEIVILTATSGDTGKAALEGFHDVEGTRIIVFYPEGGVSAVQRAQMASQNGGNVHVCAVKGNFDDCQRGVKAAFAGIRGSDYGKRLSSANSINIGRLAPQTVYYFSAYAQLLSRGRIKLGDKVDFIVPTGNFGDILAGFYAKLMGLPVGRLVCASNMNNVLYDFIESGTYDARREFYRTSSPSMDILVSSNLERLLFLASGGNTEAVRGWMDELGKNGVYTVDRGTLGKIRSVFSAGYADEEEALSTIGRIWHDYNYLCDPHTAVAFHAAEEYKRRNPEHNCCVVLSTASPYKFPSAVLKAIGGTAQGDEFQEMEALSHLTGSTAPPNLAGLRDKPLIHRDVIEKTELIDYVKKILSAGGRI
ncbi:MAG: threonine synthase [Candidatus Limivicinus sp.]|jgi:threonine synthase